MREETSPAAAAGSDGGPEPSSATEPLQVYGPDDPAYGPPGPGWYQRNEEPAPRAEDTAATADKGEAAAVVRGPFEPLHSVDQASADQAPVDQDSANEHLAKQSFAELSFADQRTADPADEPAERPPGAAADPAAEADLPDVLDFGTPADPEAGPLGDIRDMYLTAQGLSPARLERHFDELLERQRKLIREYFDESGALGPAAEAGTAPAFGFDTADSLAALRGEQLRSGS